MKRLVIAILVAFAASLVSVPTAHAVETTAVARFGACLKAQKAGDMLLMIDESGSLQDSDPDSNRVKAAQYLVEQLAQFASDTGVVLDVAIAGFSDDYRVELGWTELTSSSVAAVNSSLGAFAGRNTGQDTDYWLALDGARQTFADAPANAEGNKCQALAWFTDGKLDFSQRPDATKPYAPEANLDSPDGVQATIAAAQESICRERGLADQLRSSGIITFGIGLTPSPEQVADFDLMKAIVTGDPAGSVTSCGAITDPVPGDFYLAQNIDDLLFAFDALSTPGAPPTEINTGACGGAVCEEAKHIFVLDRSVKTVSVLAAADRVGLVPYLVSPDGTQLALDAGPSTVEVGGVTIDYRPQGDKSVSFKMTGSSGPQWQGVWALVFVDPTGDNTAATRSSIHITGDLVPVWPDADATTLHSGDSDIPITFAVQDSAGAPFDPAELLGQASLTATLIDVAGGEHPVADLPKDQIATPQTLDLAGVPPGAATLQMSLNITTADAVQPNGVVVPGTVLAPQRVDLPVTVDPPVGYPTVDEVIDFGELEGTGALTADLAVAGAGCVWLPDDAATTVAATPDGVDDVALTSPSNSEGNCVKPADGQGSSLPVTLTVDQEGNGAINGTTTVMVGPADDSAEPVAVEVKFTASLIKPLNVAAFGLTFLIALIVGIGLPFLLLYLAKFATSKIPARALRVQQIPVTVNGSAVLRDGQEFQLSDGDLVALVSGLDRPSRQIQVDGITLRSHTGVSPFGSGYVVATAPGRAGAGGVGANMHGKTPDAKLPLAVHNTWFVLHDPMGPPEIATVVLLASGDAGMPMLKKLVAEVNANTPRVLSTLRARTRQATTPGPQPPAPPPNPFAQQDPYASAPPTNPFNPNPFTPGQGGYSPPPPPNNPYHGPNNPHQGDPNNPFR